MLLTDGKGIPLTFTIHSASPHEVKLAETTLKSLPKPLRKFVQRLVADRGYDSDPLRNRLKEQKIQLIAPERCNKRVKLNDGRVLRRYKKRWRVERCFSWLHNFRRLVVRWDRNPLVYAAFVRIACITIILRHF